MSQFKIEKGIPLPEKTKYPFEDMEVGDSFFDDTSSEAKIRGAAGLASQHGHKFKVTKTPDGYRCWRIA